jgi:8-oxo-dGTP diphosphatase
LKPAKFKKSQFKNKLYNLNEMKREFSAGGVVLKDGKVLMIKVRTLSGREVWTFPKGHIEKGETKEQAALREVEEETGVKAKIKDKIGDFTYFFKDKNGGTVKKTVFWFLMEPEDDSKNIKTPGEIIDLGWFPIEEAEKLITYDSDKRIISIIKNKFLK